MKVSIQSLGKRTQIIGPALLLLSGACNSGSTSTGTAPFMATGAAGAVAAAPTATTSAAAGRPATAPTAAGVAAPTGAAAGSGSVTPAVATAGSAAPTTGAAGTPAAASGTTSAAPAADGTFTSALAVLSNTKNSCGTCHKSAAVGGGLMFDPSDKAGTYAALVGPMSKGTNGSSCGGKTYVVPGKPEESLLYDKISKAMPVCGLRMPASGIVLEDAEIATIKAWIMAGAPNN